MKLLITEKPSVAKSIAKVVGATESGNGYVFGNGYIVSWCYGHLVELAEPSAYGEQYAKWAIETLPIIPSHFQTSVSEKTASQYRVLKTLMERDDVTELIEATDAGREGELIFRLVYEKAGCRKPFSRLWISSMEDSAIRAGLSSMKPGRDYDTLYAAAMCRQRADWLVGINATRLYTTLYRRKLTVGRVQTPTLALIVQRWHDRQFFKPDTYYRLGADLGGWSVYRQENDRSAAVALADRCRSEVAVIQELQRSKKTTKAPALYDLTTLQRDANRYFGYSAKQTLDCLQSLYEAKLATYPRTDSRYITHDMVDSTQALLGQLLAITPVAGYDLSAVAVDAVVNDAKVSDHHAVLPTREVSAERLQSLPTGERNILLLISYRLLSAVYAPHEYMATKVTALIADEEFTATGREELSPGYTLIDRAMKSALSLKPEKEKEKEELTAIPNIAEGQRYPVRAVAVEEKQTKPPALYTEDTLLAAMETAGKKLDDPELREAMKDSGLGTPATRAGIIENIINTGYVVREKKNLVPTEQGILLINLVVEQLKKPELTGQWEASLAHIQQGHIQAGAFLDEIILFTGEIISQGKAAYNPATAEQFQRDHVLGKCPLCGRDVVEGKKSYGCVGWKDAQAPCKFAIWKEIAGKKITPVQAGRLLNKKRSALIHGFTGKSGKQFDAFLFLRDDGSVGFEFPSNK